MLCTAVAFLYASEANGQCAVKDVLQNVAAPRIAAAIAPSIDAVRETWKTITLGRFTNSFALRNALDAAGCGVGAGDRARNGPPNLAEEPFSNGPPVAKSLLG